MNLVQTNAEAIHGVRKEKRKKEKKRGKKNQFEQHPQ
jgi:hypothetical protein